PLYWLLVTALKGEGELYQATPSLYPLQPTLAAFSSVLVTRGFLGLLRNSIVVCGATVLLVLAIGFAVTYPITRLKVSRRLRVGVLNWALSLRFLPPVAVVVPYFAIVRGLGLYDRRLALVLILTASPRAQTFPVGVQGLVTQFEIIWNDMAAAGAIALAVPLGLMVVARRYVLAGLTFGVIRGQ